MGRKSITNSFYAFIPNKISNRVVLLVLEWMRSFQKIFGKKCYDHKVFNENNMKKHEDSIFKFDGYIEDQKNYADLQYGKSTMDYSGCEILAVYNAITNLEGKEMISLPDLISIFEKDGMILSGKFGTTPKSLMDFLKLSGYETFYACKMELYQEVDSKSDSLILSFFNDKDDIKKGIHTVHISKENKFYIAHNVYCNGSVPKLYSSLDELIKNINNGKIKCISLIGIKKKRQE